jgi:hypothetical protein
MAKNKLFVLFVLAILLAMTFYIVHAIDDDNKPEVFYSNVTYAINVSDDRELAGFATDIFIGEVIEQTGRSTEPDIRTHFSVEIRETIKGNATGKVIVNQFGGYEREYGKKYLSLAEGDELLQQGETYLFVTKGNEERGYTFVPGYGNILIKSQNDYQREKSRFQKAYAEEIPFKYPEKKIRNQEEVNTTS